MDDRLFTEREEEEQNKEFEEEAEEDYYEYLDYDFNDLERIEARIPEPEVTTWSGCDGKTLEGQLVDCPILGRSKNISVFDDACPICFKPLTGSGKHQICCLPCGHIYGSSCINQWLHQRSKKCPQCKSLCTLKDVTLLRATRPCDARDAVPKVYAKRFPFTKQGFKAFKRYALRRLDDESGMGLEAMRRHDFHRHQRRDILLRCGSITDEIWRVTGRLACREANLQSRIASLMMRIRRYNKSIALFVQRYKEHMTQDKDELKRMATTANPITISIHTPSPSTIALSYNPLRKARSRISWGC